jgi:hypothetical protein
VDGFPVRVVGPGLVMAELQWSRFEHDHP